jgi:hypothetical protein
VAGVLPACTANPTRSKSPPPAGSTVRVAVRAADTSRETVADAVKRGRLRRSPADGVSPPTATRVRSRWWTIDELRAFLLNVLPAADEALAHTLAKVILGRS